MAPARMIEFVEALRADGYALAAFPGNEGRYMPKDRDMDMLHLRLIDGPTLRQIGERHRTHRERLRQTLVQHFGVRGRLRW